MNRRETKHLSQKQGNEGQKRYPILTYALHMHMCTFTYKYMQSHKWCDCKPAEELCSEKAGVDCYVCFIL